MSHLATRLLIVMWLSLLSAYYNLKPSLVLLPRLSTFLCIAKLIEVSSSNLVIYFPENEGND